MTPSTICQDKALFAQQLVEWYLANGRDLPWRNTTDPYAIWLSEVMLQQTQVDTVIPYYHRFLAMFPTIQALAEAPLDTVLKQWEGLGYYSRCRNLHKAAQQIMEHYGGRFPDTIDAVQSLPGIGQSTAGAILTFAYGQKHPILDGNVKRVLSRVMNRHEDIAATTTVKAMWDDARMLMAPTEDSYSYNQAIMELGALICIPKQPKCLICPVSSCCDAFANGTQAMLPVKAAKKATPHFTIGVGVIRNAEGKVLIQQRPEEGLLGGLWEFPGGKQEANESLPETVRREIAEELGIQVNVGEPITQVKHAYSHFKITLHAYWCEYVSGQPESRASQGWKWVTLDELSQYAFPKANNRILDVILNA